LEEPNANKKDTRIFLERGDGLGWTLNFSNKWSYLVLLLLIAVIIGCIVWINTYPGKTH
jgi:uncharacterized membrane protein